MVCCFFGHKEVPSDISFYLSQALEELIKEGADMFLVGHQGGFDSIVLHTLQKLKKSYPHISYYVVLAYMPGERTGYELYTSEETFYPEGLEEVHPRYAISRRNEYMVREADIVVTYVTHSWGGAAKFAALAAKKGKRVINMADRL